MGKYHSVKQGEHLVGIAQQYGFTQHEKIWGHPSNKNLRTLRSSPHILFPGDQVFIPEIENREENCSTDKLHRFRAKRDTLSLWLKLSRFYNDPLAHTECELLVDSKRYVLTTDDQGVLHHAIRPTSVDVVLLVKDRVTYKGEDFPLNREFHVRVGHLDPVEETAGQVARLTNLGYYRGAIDSLDQEEFLSAIEEFQLEHGLSVDGVCGPNTQAKLKLVHGC